MQRKKKIKFFRIYDSLSHIEKKQFHSFLKLSFVPKVGVSKIILNHMKSNSDLSQYLNSNFSPRSVWNICSELTKPIEQFLAVKELLGDGKEISVLMRRQMNKRDLDTLLEHEYKNAISKLLSSKMNDTTLREIKENSLRLLYLSLKTGDSRLKKQAFNMYHNFYSLNFLFETILVMTGIEVTNFINEKLEVPLMEKIFPMLNYDGILKVIKKQFPDFYPVIKLHFDIYKLLEKGSSGSYRKTSDAFFGMMDKFSDKYKTQIFEILLECLIRNEDLSKDEVDREMFELLSKKVEAGLVYDLSEYRIGFNHFRDNILIALKVGETEWAEMFVSEFSYLLPEKQRMNDVNTAWAFISLSKGNYHETLKFISNVRRTYSTHYHDFFRISAKANFELGNYDECFSISEKYRDYLRRTEKSGMQYVSGSKMFLKNFKRLVNYKLSSNVKYLNQIEYDLQKSTSYSENIWIEKKLNENINRKVSRKAI
jgi:hypothetical protein